MRSGPARTATACRADTARQRVGACWAFIWDKLNYFIYGSYPVSERWRVDTSSSARPRRGWLLWLKAPRRDSARVFLLVFPVLSYPPDRRQRGSRRPLLARLRHLRALVIALFAFSPHC